MVTCLLKHRLSDTSALLFEKKNNKIVSRGNNKHTNVNFDALILTSSTWLLGLVVTEVIWIG